MRTARTPHLLGPAVAAVLVTALTVSGCGSESDVADEAAAASTEVNGITVDVDADAAALLPDQYADSIRIVTSAPYPPFETFDENQELVGLDIDLGNAIAATLGTRAEWTSIDYNGIIPALQAGKYDMVLASIGDTPEREEVLDFVNYSKQGQVLLVPAGNPDGVTGLQDLCGTTMAVESGNVTEGYFAELDDYCADQGQDAMTVRELPKTSDALLSLKSGQAASVYLGVATAADLMTQPDGEDYEVVTPEDKPFGYLPRWVGAGIPKNAPELRDAVQAALEKLLADGTLEELYAEYGQEQILIDEIVVNKVVEEKLLS